MITKVTVGFVVQKFTEDGLCVSSEFVAGDNVSFENDLGETIHNLKDLDIYSPFDMVQPKNKEVNNEKTKSYESPYNQAR
ncbi:MAG: hypothetical protein WCS56_00220 [Bacilli bacterium]